MTLTWTLIIMDITKISPNNSLKYSFAWTQQDGINILRLALHIKKTLQSKAVINLTELCCSEKFNIDSRG